MKRSAQLIAVTAAVAVFSSFSTIASAGISGVWTSLPSNNYYVPPDQTTVGTVTGTTVNTWGSQQGDYEWGGTLDGDPTVFLIENIKNTTLTPWTGYEIIIMPDPSYTVVAGTVSVMNAFNPSFQKFGPVTVTETDGPYPNPITGPGWIIDYSGGTVGPGETTQFVIQFDITDTAGSFAYHISNTPVPEPASLMLLAPAVMFFAKRRRRVA